MKQGGADTRGARERFQQKVVMTVLGLAAFAFLAIGARADDLLENKVKAAYLYKFGAFVEWPATAFESSGSAINLCVAGKDPFDGFLDKAVEGQKIGDRAVIVRRLDTVEHGSGCQILFAGGSNQQSIAQALDAVRGTGTLTVTDDGSDGTAGMVRFVIQDNHVRFDIDERAASREGLKISSKLLSLAVSFRPG